MGEIPIDLFMAMNKEQTYTTSLWFTPQQGEEMAHLADIGLVDLHVYETEIYSLEDVNLAMEHARTKRIGGFSNYVIP